MEERNDSGGRVVDEVMLPGFRFHPTDEELVGFYLKRKIQQRPLSIELIKHLDIYKYDPWDLPKLSSSGEKEWYFYCPRDRKYRNSARPNRVTRAGFWKATGTDRPIYSSEGSSSKCIGLKKSLVFYKGRAAKGVKTDWMMHEFRLPSLTDSSPKKYMDHKTNIPANESWAICRIFKKTNATAQRALSHSWVAPLHETTTTSDVLSNDGDSNNNQFCSANMTKKPTFPMSQFCTTAANHNDTQVHYLTTTSSSTTLCPLDNVASYYKPIINPLTFKPFDRLPISTNGDLISTASALFETSTTNCTKSSNIDVSSLLLSMSSSVLGDFSKTPSNGLQGQHIINNNGYPIMPLQREMMQLQGTICNNQDDESVLLPLVKVPSCVNVPRGGDEQMSFNIIGDAWKSSILWDTSSCATSDDAPSGYSTTTCYST